MLYEIATSKKGTNSFWLAERFGTDQKTTWAFRQKVQIAMKSSGQNPFEDEALDYVLNAWIRSNNIARMTPIDACGNVLLKFY